MCLFNSQPRRPNPSDKTTGSSASSPVLDISRIMRQSCIAFKRLVRSPIFFARCDIVSLTQRMWQATGNAFQEMQNQHPRHRCKTFAASKPTDSYKNLLFSKVSGNRYLLNLPNKIKPCSHSLDGDNHQRQPPTATCLQALSETRISKVVCVSWTSMRVTCKCSLK